MYTVAPHRLTWRDRIELWFYTATARGAKRLAAALEWAQPIRDYLIWTPVLSGLAGAIVGLVIRTALLR